MHFSLNRTLALLRTGALALSCCLVLSPIAHADRLSPPDMSHVFAGRDGCFALYDLKANKVLLRSNPRRCAQETSPCSTFKVPLSLIAFDAGLLKDERSGRQWDGQKRSLEAWNKDQTAASWMRYSVVWFSQELTGQLGRKKLQTYLSRLSYGNQDLSGGLDRAWLESSLQVSPDQQLNFWRRFWLGKLPVSRHALKMTRSITRVGTSPKGWTVHGKTGSCRLPYSGTGAKGASAKNATAKATPAKGASDYLKLGWFVGHVGLGDRSYLFVVSYTDQTPSQDSRPGGFVAREMAQTLLAKMGLY